MVDKGKKFDVVLMNPPYDGTLHIKFFNKCLDILNGKLVIVEPSTWVMDVKTQGRGNATKIYNPLKKKIDNHVESVYVERMNKEFGISLYMPISITTVDNTKTFNTIDFDLCGKKSKVKSIFDCNHIGDNELIQSIIDKCQQEDVMFNHRTSKTLDDKNIKYLRYMTIITIHDYDSQADVIQHKYGKYYGTYITPTLHKSNNQIIDEVPKTKAGNSAACVYGTKEEMENWKYFVMNNKLPLFINAVFTIDQHNNSEKYMPWIVDGKYSDKEIYNRLKFTKDEIELIEDVVERFGYNSEWYKRWMLGQ